MNVSDNRKPIVRIVDVRKTYVMGHPSGGGLFGRRKGVNDQPVVVNALSGVSVDFERFARLVLVTGFSSIRDDRAGTGTFQDTRIG